MSLTNIYRSLFVLLIAAGFGFFAVPAFAADLQVGPNATYKTIQAAASAASSGDTIHVAPGNYPGGFQITKSGIKIISDTKWGAKIVNSGNGKSEAIDIRGSNVTIDGFDISGADFGFGIYMAGSGSVAQNNKVHDMVRSSTAWSRANSGGQGGAGIMGDSYYGGSNITVRNNIVYNIGPDSQTSSLVHGIYMATSGQVVNNVIINAVGDGITSWHDASNLKIINNTVAASQTGVMIGAGGHYNSSGPNTNSQISNNIIYANNKGIEEFGEVGSNTYTNNLVFQNGTNWLLKNASHSGTISADPQFVAYNANGTGDYRLKSTSPAINKGAATNAPTTDIDGASRPAGGSFDIGAYEYGGTGGGSTTPPPTTGPCINYYAGGITIPFGYGAAFNVFSTTREPLVHADCSGTIPVLEAGDPDNQGIYVYKQGYVFKSSAWQPISFIGLTEVVSDAWYSGFASASLGLSAAELTNWNYAVAYVCQWIDSSWKCGCADTMCESGMWQLQAFRR